MLKIRLQGTIGEIQWFRRVLDDVEEIEITEFSRPFINKGTKRYYRVYAEAIRKYQEKGAENGKDLCNL